MPKGTTFDPNQHINKALAAIDAQIAQLQAKREQLAAVIGGGKKASKKASTAGAPKPKRAMSEEAKQKIREAQQKRWADAKAATKKKK